MGGKQEAHIVAIASSQAPEGHTHWTMRLLANKVAATMDWRFSAIDARVKLQHVYPSHSD